MLVSDVGLVDVIDSLIFKQNMPALLLKNFMIYLIS